MNAIYPLFTEAMVRREPGTDLIGGTVRAVLIGNYEYRPDHAFATAIPEAAWISVSAPLVNKRMTGKIFAADNIEFRQVVGPHAKAVVLFMDDPAAMRLVAHLDQAILGLPLVPNGGNVPIEWDRRGIFAFGRASFGQ